LKSPKKPHIIEESEKGGGESYKRERKVIVRKGE